MPSVTNRLRRAVRTRRHLGKMRDFGAVAAGIVQGLPERAERVLVLAPHPDDESIGCGGTLKQLAKRGAVIDVVFMTDGAAPGDRAVAAQRQAEARAAARVLGLHDMHFLGGQDGGLRGQPELCAPLERSIERHDYQVLFCPWPHDAHADHQATFALLRDAMGGSRHAAMAIWLYEVWSPLPANRLVDIASSTPAKMQAIGCHKSQMAQKDYVKLARGMARKRARSSGAPRTPYAEAFYVCDVSALADIEQILEPRR